MLHSHQMRFALQIHCLSFNVRQIYCSTPAYDALIPQPWSHRQHPSFMATSWIMLSLGSYVLESSIEALASMSLCLGSPNPSEMLTVLNAGAASGCDGSFKR